MTVLLALVVMAVAPSAAQAAKCSDFPNQAAAQQAANTVDADGDGIYCETLPCPCSNGTPTPAPSTPAEPAPATPVGKRTSVTVVSVTDGDTIRVRTKAGARKTVRLIGIDTPETKKPGASVECGGPQATAAMRKLVLTRKKGRVVGRAAVLVSDPSQGATDRYGRTLAYVEVGGRDVGRSLVRAGWAAVFVYAVDFARVGDYRTASGSAETAGAGVWGRCGGNFHRPQ